MKNTKSILIVDDEIDVVDYLKLFFEDKSYDTFSASNGQEALEILKKHKPDLITMDISMPKKSGVKLYEELKKTPSLSD